MVTTTQFRRFIAASLLLLAVECCAQSTGTTVRKHREAAASPANALLLQAEAALQKQDYSAAEPLLLKAVAQDPADYRSWFDLGFLYRATNRPQDAMGAYRKSIAIDPKVFESNLNLGQLYAKEGNVDEGLKFLRAATELKPQSNPSDGLASAWLSIAQLLQQKNDNAGALDASRRAAKFNPKDTEPHLLAGGILEKQDDFNGATNEYKVALAINPKSQDALAGLVDAYTRNHQLDLAAETLRDYLKLDPTNPAAHLQMGRLLLKSGKTEEALAEFEAGLKGSPKDFDLRHEIAAVYASTGNYKESATRYAQLVEARPNDADLRFQYGVVEMQLREFKEAEQQLIAALKINPRLTDAYGNLAVAASENKDYVLTLRALEARAKLVPESPSTYFLRATAYDNLRAFKEASENYRQFLAVANGKYPDQEFQARHRLIAIDKDASKKK
jgi:tetratricopeptide (TPR) repeat protein